MRAITAAAAVVLRALAWIPVPAPAQGTEQSLPENRNVTIPWARQPPVDVYRRVAAIQPAPGGLHNAVNACSQAIQAQADAHNRRVLTQAELARAGWGKSTVRAPS